MLRVISCIYEQHDLWLVGAAAVVCVCSWIVAVLGLGRMEMAEGKRRHVWLLLAGGAAGGGVWATHFIAMLAYEPGLPIGFSLPITLISALIGVGCAWGAFELHRTLSGAWGACAAGAVLACGIVGVHFVGMLGLEAQAQRLWAPELIVASLFLVAALAVLGFAVLTRAQRLVACAFFVAGVVTLHFTAMGALTLAPDPRLAAPQDGLDRVGLAAIVTMAAAALIVIAAVAVFADRRIVEEKLRRAEEADEAKSHFLASMSHELRTPLNAIIGYSELIMETSSEDVVISDARNTREAAGHLLRLVNDVLDLAKVEAKRLALNNVECDMSELLDTLRPELQRLACERHNTLEIVAAGVAVPAVGDPARIKQCLLNLVSNAAKFTEHGTIRVDVTGRGGRVLIAVTDTGIGMDAEQVRKLFRPFSQDGASKGYSGAGLGLSIAKRLMELMSGDIAVESAPGRGSTFTLSFPSTEVTSPAWPSASGAWAQLLEHKFVKRAAA